MKITDVTVIEVDAIEVLIKNMHRIAFKRSALTHDEQRDLQNLIALLQDRIRDDAVVLDHIQIGEDE
jgi:hypothetical protein